MMETGLSAHDGPVLITGVSGFVGSAVARAFASAGYWVRGLARRSSPRTNLRDFPGELVVGDLLDPNTLTPALAGCSGLVHVAGDHRLWARDPKTIMHNNVFGTTAIMRMALKAGIERVVHTSSAATLDPRHPGPATEERALSQQDATGAYRRSKVASERVVEQLVRTEGLNAVIVNPCTPIGPRDVGPTPIGRIIIHAATGKMPAYVDTGLNLVHVDDVAEGHLLAYKAGKAGGRYILGGQDVSLRDLLTDVTAVTGRKPPRWRLPRLPTYPAAWVAEAIARKTGREPMVTTDALRMARYAMHFSSEKAGRELGYEARPYREGLADALHWFEDQGMLR